MSNEQVAEWLAALPEIEGNEALTEIDNNDDGNGAVIVYEETQDSPRYVLIQVLEDDKDGLTLKYVVFAPEAFTYQGTEIPAGWSLLQVDIEEVGGEDQYTFTDTPIEVRTNFDFGETVTVTSVSNKLSAINGEAIGIIEGEPVRTFDIDKVGTNCTISGSDTIDENETVTLTVTPDAGYALPDYITVSKAEYDYDKNAGTIVLSYPTDDVYVEVVCESALNISQFEVSDTFNSIVVNPSALTENELATAVNAMTNGDVLEYTAIDNRDEPVPSPKQWSVKTIDSQKALVIPLTLAYTPDKNSDVEIICIADAATYTYTDSNGTTTLSLQKGWNVVTSGDGSDGTATVRQPSNFEAFEIHAYAIATATVTTVSDDLAAINGVAVGKATL